MERSKTNYVINALMVISFIITAVTGLIMFFFLPSGVSRGGYQESLGITKHIWITVHNWSGIILIILVIIHLVLHLGWIVSMTKNIFSKKE